MSSSASSPPGIRAPWAVNKVKGERNVGVILLSRSFYDSSPVQD